MKSFSVLLVLAILGAGASPSNVFGAPAEIIVLRHAEKPAEGNELSPRGFERAKALVNFFLQDPRIVPYGRPAAIYAMGPKSPGGSVRAIQTMTPLAQALGLPIHQQYTRKELEPLTREILGESSYDGHLVVICWEHEVIPSLAADLGLVGGPSDWPDDVFDRAWVLRYANDQVVDFEDLPQRLLPGDSEQ